MMFVSYEQKIEMMILRVILAHLDNVQLPFLCGEVFGITERRILK